MSKSKLFSRLLVLCVVAVGAAAACWTCSPGKGRAAAAAADEAQPAPTGGAATKRYTATATLLITPTQPNLLGGATERFNLDEFEVFRNTQAALMRQRFVLMAALRNPKMKDLPSVLREDARHNTIRWLASILHVNLEKKSSIMTVSVTLPDAGDAAAIVNAVVGAYMDEVVNRDQGKRRDRLDSLTAVSAQKEEEVRKLLEELKHEGESTGMVDAKVHDVEPGGRATVAAQFLRLKLENTERILRGVTDERERLKIELDNPRLRVTVVGDPNSPAAVPENPD